MSTSVTETGEHPAVATPYQQRDGRFISRGALFFSALYWFAWISVSGRTVVVTGVVRELEALGLGAIRLITSAAILTGLIVTFQTAAQLHDWGAETMAIRAIAWFGAREIGPVVVALLVVARSASSISGELASMRTSGEIDALRAMGLDPVKYLVSPKLVALCIALPALTILANGLIALGGLIGTNVFLGYSMNFFFEEFRSNFELRDLGIGLAKSVIFAFIIILSAADEGLNAERRVTGIGEATTRAVVHGVIGVLAADTVVNAVFYFIPGLA